jgi:hypothetical protein
MAAQSRVSPSTLPPKTRNAQHAIVFQSTPDGVRPAKNPDLAKRMTEWREATVRRTLRVILEGYAGSE